MVINVEEKGELETAEVHDEEGFMEVTTRKTKKERRTSKIFSQSAEDKDVSETRHQIFIRNLSLDTFWADKHIFDDAEAKFYAQRAVVNDDKKEEDKKEDDKKDDDDDNCNDKKDEHNGEDNEDKERQKTPLDDEDEVEDSDYNWTDESTYLSPQIPVITPAPLHIVVPKDSEDQLRLLSQQVKDLSTTLEFNNESMKDQINNNNTKDNDAHASDKLVYAHQSQMQVEYGILLLSDSSFIMLFSHGVKDDTLC
jgi:hypothetical protein